MTAPERLADERERLADIERRIIRLGAKCHGGMHSKDQHSALACWKCSGSLVDPSVASDLRELLAEYRAELLRAAPPPAEIRLETECPACSTELTVHAHPDGSAMVMTTAPQQTEPELWLVEYERTQASGHDARVFFTEQEADEEAENHGGTVASFYRSPPPALEPGQRIEGAWIWDHFDHEEGDLRPRLAWSHQEHHPGAKVCTLIIHGATGEGERE